MIAATALLPVSAQQQFPQQPPPPQDQQQQPGDDEGYAPEHGVARISLANGDVSVRRGDSGELSAAALNGPLVVNDHLATGPSGRAEIQFDWGNMIRLGPDSEVRLGELEDRRYLIQIAAGTTTFHVSRESGADVEISTPTVSVRPAEQGSYRITVFPDGTTEITVRSGRADILSPRGSETLTAGRTMEARGTPNDPEYMLAAAIPQDQWDSWNADRDRALERTSSYRYVSPDIVGAEELDQNGRWNNDPQYGNVWVPNVDPGWAPYREGRWVWEDYYGWTWLSSDPFGWAPYHYGNWYQSSFGWAWYPGPIGGRHYWRPAMVGFFGWGSGFGGVGFGFGNVGWVPLAPFERFHPWYGRGFNNTRIVNNVTVVNNFRNARFVNGRNGVTSVNAADFGRGRQINSNNFVRASNNDLARAGSVQGRLPFTASADARRFSDRQVNTQSLPRVNSNTRFSAPAARGTSPASVNNPSGGWRRLDSGAPGASGVARQQNPAPQANRGNNSSGPGWRTFNGGGANAPARSAPVQNGSAPQVRNYPSYSAPQSQQQYRQSSPQQPVRISPPIVRERGPSPAASRPEPQRGGFGTPRPQGGGGGGGGGQRSGGGGNRGGGGGHERR